MSETVDMPGHASQVLVFRPSGFVVIRPLLVALVSEGTPRDGCQDCRGALAVSYLTRLNGLYQPDGPPYDVGAIGATGEPPTWKSRTDLFADPTIEADTRGALQGCQRTLATLVELTLSGPLQRASGIVVAASNGDGTGKLGAVTYTGVIEPDVLGHSFEVAYTGAFKGVTKWTGELIQRGVAPAPWRQTEGPALPDC
jgi:hypothetical protein